MLSLDVLLQSDARAACFTLLVSAASSLGTTVGFVVAGSVAHGSKMNPKAHKKTSKIPGMFEHSEPCSPGFSSYTWTHVEAIALLARCFTPK